MNTCKLFPVGPDVILTTPTSQHDYPGNRCHADGIQDTHTHTGMHIQNSITSLKHNMQRNYFLLRYQHLKEYIRPDLAFFLSKKEPDTTLMWDFNMAAFQYFFSPGRPLVAMPQTLRAHHIAAILQISKELPAHYIFFFTQYSLFKINVYKIRYLIIPQVRALYIQTL